MISAIPRDLLESLRELARSAVQTMAAAFDPDARWLRPRSAWLFPVVHEASEAYGYGSAHATWRPSPRDITRADIVADWLAWLRRVEGDLALTRLWRWALGTPVRRLAEREKCTERTIRNRIDRSLAAILREFGGVEASVDVVDEPAPDPVLVFRSARASTSAETPREVRQGRVWIGGRDGGSWYVAGKRWNDGSHRADRAAKLRGKRA